MDTSPNTPDQQSQAPPTTPPETSQGAQKEAQLQDPQVSVFEFSPSSFF